ncbi:hypothetical protein ACLOJK_021781 [Asimina triloba]
MCRLHGASKHNPLAPLIGRLGLPLYRTSGDNSVLFDHDLERLSKLRHVAAAACPAAAGHATSTCRWVADWAYSGLACLLDRLAHWAYA